MRRRDRPGDALMRRWQLTYDTTGATKTWNGWTFAYDPDGRMVSGCKSPTCAASADKVTFAYDGEGHRTQIVKDPGGSGTGLEPTTRDFRYRDDAIVEELLTDATHTNAVVRSYVVDDSGTVVKLTIPAPEPDAGTYVPVWNGHGDAVNLTRPNTDGTLTLANSYRYETWGKPTTTTHNAIGDLGFRFTYVGEFDVQWDDQLGLGLLYMHARHYSPVLGRFVQPDPDRSEANLYAYAANNPVTELDPDGTCFIVCQLVIGAVIDAFVYLATTENASLGGLASALAGGAVESAINPFAKLNKVAKLAKAASKILGKVPKATRTAKRIASGARSFLSGSRASQRGQIRIPGPRRPKLSPDPNATGAHTTFRRDPDGRIRHYATWKPQRDPRNPNPWMLQRRFDREGSSHFNKVLRRRVPTPHVQGGRTLGGVRPAWKWEMTR